MIIKKKKLHVSEIILFPTEPTIREIFLKQECNGLRCAKLYDTYKFNMKGKILASAFPLTFNPV